jgi:mannose-6-phosphate isomerase-like protein (cupin superfamily)
MRSFDLAGLASTFGGEYVLGAKDLNTDTCYLVYGILKEGEAERLVRPGKGREEILCAVDGPLVMHTGSREIILKQGNAIHVKGDDSFLISNPSDRPVVYIMAGGNTRSHRDKSSTKSAG